MIVQINLKEIKEMQIILQIYDYLIQETWQ